MLDHFPEASWRLALQTDYALALRESSTRRYDDLERALDGEPGRRPKSETRAAYREALGKS